MEHVVASVRLFDDDTCETRVIAAGPRVECEQVLKMQVFIPYEGTKTIIRSELALRERNEWDALIAQIEAEQRVMFGRKPS